MERSDQLLSVGALFQEAFSLPPVVPHSSSHVFLQSFPVANSSQQTARLFIVLIMNLAWHDAYGSWPGQAGKVSIAIATSVVTLEGVT